MLLGRAPGRAREPSRGLLHVPVVFLIVLAVDAGRPARGALAAQRRDEPVPGPDRRTPGDAAVFAVVAVVGGGVREEVQRAFILHRFEQHLGGGRVGLAVSSLAFGLGHVIQGWDVAIATAALGAFWGWIYLRRRSIVAPVVSHSGFNAAEIFRYTFYGA